MHFRFRNVNDAFTTLVQQFAQGKSNQLLPISRSTSRVGDVLMIEEPIIITYTHPRERVLFNQARDANPFFHMYESLWMLAGRNDIDPLRFYSANIGDFVDDGDGIANGAYGNRWRHYPRQMWDEPSAMGLTTEPYIENIDQLDVIINHLKKVPNSRRVVLQMWNVEDDLLKIGPNNQSKDVCCNTAVYFTMREEDRSVLGDVAPHKVKVLDMTVTNRSNDLILGALGANVVHFSFLQEYMANCLGVDVGVYNQISNNLHVYTERFFPDKWLLADEDRNPSSMVNDPKFVNDQVVFDEECYRVTDMFAKSYPMAHIEDTVSDIDPSEPWLRNVAFPMLMAFRAHKLRAYDLAQQCMERVASNDWKSVGIKWIENRERMWKTKQHEYGSNL